MGLADLVKLPAVWTEARLRSLKGRYFLRAVSFRVRLVGTKPSAQDNSNRSNLRHEDWLAITFTNVPQLSVLNRPDADRHQDAA